MKKLIQSGLFIGVVFVSFSPRALSQNAIANTNEDSPICMRSGDKNKGHGNDPYTEFEMVIEAIGTVEISGDFDLDNPGTSLDKQMNIVAGDKQIQWSTLEDTQKQQIKDEWAKQVCYLSLYAD